VTGLRRYRELVRTQGALPAVLAALVGRLALGMTSLSLLLLVVQSTKSYAAGGAAAAVYAVALAACSPLRSRSADRRGQTRLLVTSGVVHPTALLAVLALDAAEVPLGALLVLVALAGASTPPFGAVMRALWSRLVSEERLLTSAYAMESVLIELAFVTGPLLVAGLVAVFGPELAVGTAAILAGCGSIGLAATTVSRAWHPEPHPVARSFAGPLVSPAVRWLLLALVAFGAGFGAIEVAAPAFAERYGSAAAAGGVLLAVWSAGSLVGGLAYGGRDWARPPERQYPRLLVALVLGTLLPPLAPGLLTLGALLLVYGLVIAPTLACTSVLLARHAPAGTVTEAFGWITTAIFAGGAVGNALAGVVAESAGPRAALLLPTGAGVLALVVGIAGRHSYALPAPAVASSA